MFVFASHFTGHFTILSRVSYICELTCIRMFLLLQRRLNKAIIITTTEKDGVVCYVPCVPARDSLATPKRTKPIHI